MVTENREHKKLFNSSVWVSLLWIAGTFRHNSKFLAMAMFKVCNCRRNFVHQIYIYAYDLSAYKIVPTYECNG